MKSSSIYNKMFPFISSSWMTVTNSNFNTADFCFLKITGITYN